MPPDRGSAAAGASFSAATVWRSDRQPYLSRQDWSARPGAIDLDSCGQCWDRQRLRSCRGRYSSLHDVSAIASSFRIIGASSPTCYIERIVDALTGVIVYG